MALLLDLVFSHVFHIPFFATFYGHFLLIMLNTVVFPSPHGRSQPECATLGTGSRLKAERGGAR